MTADAIRDEKVKVSAHLAHSGPRTRSLRGQYGRGFGEGRRGAGYRKEEGVATESRTETFVAAKLFIDNWRWSGTPFYLRTGKRLP